MLPKANEADIENRNFCRRRKVFKSWSATPAEERAACLRKSRDLYEENTLELYALATRERVNRCRMQSLKFAKRWILPTIMPTKAFAMKTAVKHRPVVWISPWNFRLAIFTGQNSG